MVFLCVVFSALVLFILWPAWIFLLCVGQFMLSRGLGCPMPSEFFLFIMALFEIKKLGFLQWNSDIGLFKFLVKYFSYILVKNFISEGYLLWFLAISWVEKASLVALSVYPPPSVSSLILLPRSSPLPPSPKRLCLFGEIHNSIPNPKTKQQTKFSINE